MLSKPGGCHWHEFICPSLMAVTVTGARNSECDGPATCRYHETTELYIVLRSVLLGRVGLSAN